MTSVCKTDIMYHHLYSYRADDTDLKVEGHKMPKLKVGLHGWATKKILQSESSKTASNEL